MSPMRRLNAQAAVKSKATEIIGHHDDDGVARFLRERFSLGPSSTNWPAADFAFTPGLFPNQAAFAFIRPSDP